MDKLKVFEAFSGIGAQSMALRNIGIPYEVVGVSEVDVDAIISYAAIFDVDLEQEVLDMDTELQKLVDINVGFNFSTGRNTLKSLKKSKKIQLINACKGIKNYGDISKINPYELPQIDLFTYSFPCQDISVAGNREGLGDGTRSGLLYECEKIIEVTKPKYLLLENVKNLVGRHFKADFDAWITYLDSLGYTSYWKVLNAKDYGIPQNRERVYAISILGDEKYTFKEGSGQGSCVKDLLESEVAEQYYIDPIRVQDKINKAKESVYNNNGVSFEPQDGEIAYNLNSNAFVRTGFKPVCPTLAARDYKDPKIVCEFQFPTPIPLQKVLKDVLEDNVDEKYYVNKEFKLVNKGKVQAEFTHINYDQAKRIHSTTTYFQALSAKDRAVNHILVENDETKLEGITPTVITDNGEGSEIMLPAICASRGRNPDNPSSRVAGEPTEQRLEVNSRGIANTISTVQKDNYALETNYRVRKLTPLECWRLMSFSDEDFYKAKGAGVSNSQLYKQAGNSIVVKVLEGIFINLFK